MKTMYAAGGMVFVAGLVWLLLAAGWQTALAVLVMMWGNNIIEGTKVTDQFERLAAVFQRTFKPRRRAAPPA